MTKDKEDALYDKFLTAIGADPYPDPQEQFRLAIRAAVAQERERWAEKLIDGAGRLERVNEPNVPKCDLHAATILRNHAAAIRRGE